MKTSISSKRQNFKKSPVAELVANKALERRLQPDADLARAITISELVDGIKEDMREIFSREQK